MSIGSKDLHEVEVKVRLTEKQARLLEALADYHDIPRAVIARKLIHEGIARTGFAVNHTPQHDAA